MARAPNSVTRAPNRDNNFDSAVAKHPRLLFTISVCFRTRLDVQFSDKNLGRGFGLEELELASHTPWAPQQEACRPRKQIIIC